MAGDWQPMRLDLEDDIAVVALSSRIGHNINTTIGALHRAWAWANRNSVDGSMPGITAQHLNIRIGIPEFAEAMASVGWLEIQENLLVFPNFGRWNSQGAKTRLANTRRQQLSRECRASVAPEARPEKRREEKSTGEKKEPGFFCTEPEEPARVPKAAVVRIQYTDAGWTGITDRDRSQWSAAFPAVDVPAALLRAHQWALDNPHKRKKKWRAYLTRWLSGDQEKGGSANNNGRYGKPPAPPPVRVASGPW